MINKIKKLLKLEKTYCWEPTWLDELKHESHIKWCSFLWHAFIKYDFFHILVSEICYFEMRMKYIFNKELHDLNFKDRSDDPMYCNGCPFRDYSEIAYWTLGSQSCGYCHYLRSGDFEFHDGTMLLWDGCRECEAPEELWQKIIKENEEWEEHNNSNHIPNEETLEAMKDAENNINMTECTDINDMFNKLEDEDEHE
jgi:hypothetical protein